MSSQFVLTLSCDDRVGIVARVSSLLAGLDCNITDAQQFDDASNNRFFMRIVLEPAGHTLDEVRTAFAPIAGEYGMAWKMRDRDAPARVLIMVSKFDHCLVDLLYRKRIGELNMEVVAIVSNHPRAADHVPMDPAIPYHHLPVTRDTKPAQEAQLRQLIEETGAELVVLARYMQVLSDEMAAWLSGRCINIHHSFLPGFKGAKPYHQAYDRGVKMIGATSHYVTGDLDEGPIIAQDVMAITHRERAEDLVAKGRDVERRVLARAVKAHIEDRVWMNGSRTVVFDG
ncbi:formyltetrahydrofolate deformylase [Croceicoccus mobilis]|uniref:Formyltetrahydrofolate deformylase n=1 Tax=Croceicoccus mobilis TaxID=1703339 RepID=A0A917DTL9_9SPHN|nr:formyltetrahydrofolate deformylase [Croceicoccus mobilis]GGD65916.1 formyltetrahydrofolate deformylase [Croceicoccus mobilis]